MLKKSKDNLSDKLLVWYDKTKKPMPWRDDNDIYHIWLSEIMLQQTQITTVIPYYYKWLEKFPTIKDVAMADEQEILKIWEGLGYYSRAINFSHACRTIIESYDGIIPKDKNEFLKLKGVGPYIDAAVRSIGYNNVVPTIDGNVNRVMSRILCLARPPQKEYDRIYNFLMKTINKKRPGDFNQALMDLGRDVCKPKVPICNQCPIINFCNAYKKNQIDKYPIKLQSKKPPHFNVAVGVIW